LIRDEFLKHTLKELEPTMSASEWKFQLELAIGLLNQLIERKTDFEGNIMTEKQEKHLYGLLNRCTLHLDIINKELE
jgi:hypothetical protein